MACPAEATVSRRSIHSPGPSRSRWGDIRGSGVVERAEGFAILRGTDLVAGIQEGEVRAPGIDFQVCVLRRCADLEFSIVRREPVVAGQRYGDHSSREFGGDCGERDRGEESERYHPEVGHVQKETNSEQRREQTAVWGRREVAISCGLSSMTLPVKRSLSNIRISTSYCVYCVFRVPSYLDVADGYNWNLFELRL